ncbi:MAG: Hpt domain-containing protein [Deltaproteobacteria bacterium]|jgi:HPt (histidine-containing phosphotransfer) domain-containing protein|nr:Hpt domain-containing protein [Deltaproteobacteria bacterium]
MDFKALAENLGLEEDEYLELADLLVDTGMVDLSKMESAIAAGDTDAAAKAAHSIKGASGNLGIMDIYELTKTIEAELRNNNVASALNQLKEVREKLETLAKRVKG